MPIACSSTPLIGAGTFSPQPKFGFNRLYINFWYVCLLTWVPVFSDNHCILLHSTIPGISAHVIMRPNVWEPSTNFYTLDYVICEAYYQGFLWPGGFQAMPYTLRYFPSPTDGVGGLYFHANDTPDGGCGVATLPAVSSPWLPQQ